MKLTVLLFSFLLLSDFAHAENCYLSQCHTDEDGTVYREYEPVNEGGIGGFGANGGAFERHTLHSTIYEWPETLTRR